ncbi:MAG TPA: methyltransferase domain-containing protein [Sphingomicrobium sp.]|nr:methyltransferase domain-containing protein [Sphingomicrobium sp.]
MPALFDMDLRALRRDRAARTGVELFLYERAFADCLERLALLSRRFARVLLIGCPDPGWAERLEASAEHVDVRDPGPLFAARAGGDVVIEDIWSPPAAAYDLVVAVGTLDTVDNLPLALRLIRAAMRSDAFLLGAMAGGDNLPQLRAAMRAADAASGVATPHVHPRIEASALAPLLTEAGFINPVVDIDRVEAAYPTLGRLVSDLRGMGATNILTQRSGPLTRSAARAAEAAFAEAAREGRTREIFEILHFAAWTPP